MIRTITPNTLDELQYLLGRASGFLTVYFPLFREDPRTAEYLAEVRWSGATIEYTLEGRDIGLNRARIPNQEALIEWIIADNHRFNGGSAFQIEVNSLTP